MRSPLALALLALLSACSSSTPSSPSDTGTNDLGGDVTDATPDAPEVDTRPPPPAPYTCMPCLYDAECGEGGACVEVDPTMPQGLRACALRCNEVGARCDAPVAATCVLRRGVGNVCVPSVTCALSRQGAPCGGDAGTCAGRYAVCADDGRGGATCLAPCARDSDCENAFHRCQVVRRSTGGAPVTACVMDDPVGPDACGTTAVNALGVGAPCRNAACPSGLECLGDQDAGAGAYCTLSCASDVACGPGARCLEVGSRGRRCVPDDCACTVGAGDTALDRALSQARWTRCNLYFTGANLNAFATSVTRDRFRLPVFDRVHRDWLAGVRWARSLGPSLDARAGTLSGALTAMAGLLETGDAASVPPPRAIAPSTEGAPLAEATARLTEAFGAGADREALARDAEDVPPALQRALAAVLDAVREAALARDRGLRFATTEDEREHLFQAAPHFILTTLGRDRLDVSDPIDQGAILGDVVLPAREAAALAATIEAVDWAPFRGLRGVSFDASTPVGRVVVRDGEAHTYSAETYDATALVVDLGGDDSYLAPVASNASVSNRVSVLVDLAGDDAYGYTAVPDTADTPDTLPSDDWGRLHSTAAGARPISVSETGRQGSARLGVALLYDLGAGRDRYRSLRMSQGFGALGVGGLDDDGGDDQYELEAGGQGAGIVGIGVLVDRAGSDRYRTWAFSQGFAYVRGGGLLYDRDGADQYLSQVEPVLYSSPQDPTGNSSFTQGAGFGRRGDVYADRVNMSGGLGILRDLAGDDRYTTGVFGQGTGYWGGMGLLLDGAGDDRYDGRWYVQGGIAHFAFGAVVDGGGRDVHNADARRMNMTAGAGHDFSLGIFLALGRDRDEYSVPNLALGAGNANGAGIFADEGGDDTYRAASAFTLGNAGLETLTDPGRLTRPTVGIFLDGDGSDTYERTPSAPVANDAAWSQRIHAEAPSETGMGADARGVPLGL